MVNLNEANMSPYPYTNHLAGKRTQIG